jgi:hypothetical protein
MRKLIAITAAAAINLALILVFARSADEAMPTPNGEVTITELSSGSVASLAHAQSDAGSGAVL